MVPFFDASSMYTYFVSQLASLIGFLFNPLLFIVVVALGSLAVEIAIESVRVGTGFGVKRVRVGKNRSMVREAGGVNLNKGGLGYEGGVSERSLREFSERADRAMGRNDFYYVEFEGEYLDGEGEGEF